MISVYPGMGLGKMLRRRLVLFENDFPPSGGLVQSNTVRRMSQSALVSGERSRQFSITFLVSAECYKVVGSAIRFRGILVRWLLTGLDFVTAHEVVLAFCMPQKYFV